MNRIVLLLAALVAAVASAACAPVDSMTRRNAAGQPAAYQAGYADGCSSGYVAAGHIYASFHKDATRYLADPLYKSGWDDGLVTCKGEYESIRRR